MNNLFQKTATATTDVATSTQFGKLISTCMDNYCKVFQKDTVLPKGEYLITNETITPSKYPYFIVNDNMTATSKYKYTIQKQDIKYIMQDSNSIVKVKEIVPEKVYLFTFADGTVIKTVCDKNDIFDFEFAFYLALAKKLYSKSFTMDGIMHKARELKYQKYFVKIVNKGIKKFYKDQKEAEKEKEEERLKQERHKKFVAKKIAKKQKKRNNNNE